jgi:hypothetical protein
LRRWIAEGAEYQPHWAYIPPQQKPLPAAARDHAIDTLVATQLARAGLKPAQEADPATLCRRLWLDLVGLPPGPRELDDFAAAWAHDADAAYIALVDQLLASPRYGERWARPWLDVARYADSDGYEKDLPRQQWAWRDWVIRALNADLPYDRFIIEQVAGDQLPDATQDQIIATGYLRNAMVSEEGAIIAEQYRMEGMFDRMDALGKGVLGLTVQCAQCHSHKFDPITHDDYYRMFAALNDTYEATSRVYGPDKLTTIAAIQHGIADIAERVKREHADWQSRFAAWQAGLQAAALPWEVVTPIDPVWSGGLVHPQVLADGSVLSLGFRGNNGELSFTAMPRTQTITGFRLEALTHRDLIFGGPGRNIDGLFAVAELTIAMQPPGESTWTRIALTKATADFDSPERPLGEPFRLDDKDKRTLGPAAFLIDGKADTAWSPDRGPGRRNAATEVVVQCAEPLVLPEGATLRIELKFAHAGRDGHGRQNNLLGRFRLAMTSAPAPAAGPLPTEARLALEVPAAQRTSAHQETLFTAWLETAPEWAALKTEIGALWARFPDADTSILHLAERSAEDTRTTYALARGAWDRPSHAVTPGTPAFLHPLLPSADPARLAFARWLVDRRSPTAARVAVNRVWQALFGQGLIDRPEDFGVRTAEPIQAELLDWLAVDFMDRHWSQKQLIRTIVTSRTYRQSSQVTPALEERDPRNFLLARGPRFRADAEVIRDIALRTSGLLSEGIGGPSIFPPVPPSLMATSFIDIDFWKTATGPERYRRSLYVFRRRSMPDPVLTSFDAPNGDQACAGRIRSNTPLAALASLNESVFVEAAQALALRILTEGGADDAQRAVYAFRLCTSRLPRPEEVDDITALLASRRARLRDGWLSARTITTGNPETLPVLPAGATPTDAAAWTIVARVLLNLDETLSKN